MDIKVGIDRDEVASVYSGKANRCACGCAGTHRYATRWTDWSERNRGYRIDDSEINDRQVSRVVNKILRIASGQEDGTFEPLEDSRGGRYVSAEQGDRMYVVYLVPAGTR